MELPDAIGLTIQTALMQTAKLLLRCKKQITSPARVARTVIPDLSRSRPGHHSCRTIQVRQ